MKKEVKSIAFIATLLFNIAFFLLCGYGKVHQPQTATYLDPFLGTIAVAVLAYGETNLILQLYCVTKYKALAIRRFDIKFFRQCSLFIVYYVACLVYLSVMLYEFSVSYIAIFALVLCPLWMTGSRTLWTGEQGEASYFLDELGKWYVVSNVMENDDVVEIKCAAPGDRERTITIAKKKQKLDQ